MARILEVKAITSFLSRLTKASVPPYPPWPKTLLILSAWPLTTKPLAKYLNIEIDGLSFKEAVEKLAEDYGIPLPKINKSEKAIELETKSENIFDYLNLSLNVTGIPIVMRKHLLSEKIKNGVNCS